MLNDSLLPSNRTGVTCDDRRGGGRVPFPSDVVIQWHHDFSTAVRYRVMDVSDGGMRISSGFPMAQGMTGMALKLLPEGSAIDRSIMVAWCRVCETEHSRYEVGLRFF